MSAWEQRERELDRPSLRVVQPEDDLLLAEYAEFQASDQSGADDFWIGSLVGFAACALLAVAVFLGIRWLR